MKKTSDISEVKESSNISSAVDLTNYLIALPNTNYLLFFIFLVGIIFGILSNIYINSGIDLFVLGGFSGIFILVIPTLLSALFVKIVIRKTDFKKIIATTVVGEIIYAITYLLSLSITHFDSRYSQWVLFIGSAFVFVLWYYVSRLIFSVKWKALLSSVFQLIFYAIFLMSSSLFLFNASTPAEILFKFYLSSFLLLGAIYLFFRIINAPMKKSFGFSSFDAFSMFMAQWLYGKKDMEKAFMDVGTDCRTLLSMFVFKRKNDKKIFLVPYIHFGPFGNLGGSNFSFLISDALNKKYGAQTFVFHGTVTHDLNPNLSSEISKILSVCDSCLSNSSFKKAEVSYSRGKYKECFVDNLMFGDSAFISLSRAPNVTEDINFGLGLSLISTAEKYCNSATVVDQHNAETGEITSFEPGSIIGYNYLEALEDSFSKKKIRSSKLESGFSECYPFNHAMGDAGVKVAMFSTKPIYVLILIDSNGITPNFRKIIIDEIKKMGSSKNQKWEVGVFTTDTHKSNGVTGVSNPLTYDFSLLNDVKTSVLGAMLDMQPTSIYSTKKWFNISVLGPKQSIELVSTVNSIVAVAKVSAPIIIFGAVLAIIWVLSKL